MNDFRFASSGMGSKKNDEADKFLVKIKQINAQSCRNASQKLN